ncbi:MAG: hypothetical protein IPM96_11460 [Ignavibacteria bacterium]|nr:hypothetical protein [Ignavibacteria bacterium]
MKTIAFVIMILFSFAITKTTESEIKKLTVTIMLCEDYHFEIIFVNGSWWKYEYCGSELINIVPYVWDLP